MKSQFNRESIDDIFRKELKDHMVPAPKGAWGKINSQLSTKTKWPYAYTFYAAASIFLVALMSVAFWSINIQKPQHRAKLNSSSNLTITSPTTTIAQVKINQGVTKNMAVINNNTQNRVLSAVKKINVVQNKTVNYTQTGITSNEATSMASIAPVKDNPNQALQQQPQAIANTVTTGAITVQQNIINLPYCTVKPVSAPSVSTLSNKNVKGFYAGVNGSVNTVWIMDKVALRDKNFDYRFTSGFTYGVQGGYNFSNNFGLESGIMLNARDGQNYVIYINSIVPVNKSVVLNYTEIPLIVKYKIPQISGLTGMPVVLNLDGGLSYGYLRNAYTFVEGDKAGSRRQYPGNEINAIAGFNYDFYTSHPYSVSLGFQCEYGINTTDNEDPGGTTSFTTTPTNSRYSNGSDFSSPHNLSVGITAAINYNFSLFHR